MNKILIFIIVGIILSSIAYADTHEDLWNDASSVFNFDETTGDLIDIKSGFNLSNTGVEQGVTGKINNAYNYDGTTSNYSTGDYGVNYYNHSQGAISFWFKIDDLSNDIYLASYSNKDLTTRYSGIPRIQSSSKKLGIMIYAGGNNFMEGNTTLLTNVWYHGVLMSNSTETSIYLNGNKETITEVFGTNEGKWFDDLLNPNSLTIGALRRSSGYILSHNGQVDEYIIFNRSLTQDEINFLYNNGDGFELTAPPVNINIINNSFTTTDTTPQIFYNVSNVDTSANCSLYVDDVYYDSDTINTIGDYNFTITPELNLNTYEINITCSENGQDDSDIINITITNTIPVIVLNNQSFQTNNTFFTIFYNVTDDENDSLNCYLYMDDNLKNSSLGFYTGNNFNFSVYNLSNSTYNTYINCSDGKQIGTSNIISIQIGTPPIIVNDFNLTMFIPNNIYRTGDLISINSVCKSGNIYCNSSTVCEINVYNPDSSVLVFNRSMDYNYSFFKYTLPNNLKVGTYTGTVYCYNEDLAGIEDFNIEITENGYPVNDLAFILGVGLTIGILFFFAFSIKMPELTILQYICILFGFIFTFLIPAYFVMQTPRIIFYRVYIGFFIVFWIYIIQALVYYVFKKLGLIMPKTKRGKK